MKIYNIYIALKEMIEQNWSSASVQGASPPAGRITNFVLIVFWASYVIYLYNIYIYIYIYIYYVYIYMYIYCIFYG